MGSGKLLYKIYYKIRFHFLALRLTWNTFCTKVFLRAMGVSYGDKFRIRGKLFLDNRGTLEIGNNVTFNSASWANPIGGIDKIYIQISKNARLKIGDFTGISNTAITCQRDISIGSYVMIGADCKIYDTDFHPMNVQDRVGQYRDDTKTVSKPIVIEDGAFIGGGSYILKGSFIGKNAIIGAGSVVTGHVPEGEIWAGNPARFIKKIPMPGGGTTMPGVG